MASETGHTPGPWEYRDVAIYSTVALMDWADPQNPSPRDYVMVVDLTSAMSGNSEADARLIAAAPDLLKALRGCLNPLELFAEGDRSDAARRDAAKRAQIALAAIAKAEGK